MTGLKWKQMISKMDDRTLMEAEVSLHTLTSWIGFNKEYGWTGLSSIQGFIREELNKRNKEYGTIIFQVNQHVHA
jgi:hypothetical protein